MLIERYSDISSFRTLIIDNYNANTNSLICVQRIDFVPVYRVFKRSRSDNNVHEHFYLNEVEAMKYFSQLMGEKLELF